MIVDDLAELKLYVVNRLFEEAERADNSKTRISALAKLGEVDGIDAFKKRSEVTHVIKPIEEVEKELLSVLEGIEYRVVDENAAKPDQI
jgi:vacuolar-type H+-ATPase subunit I/STV1